MRRSSVRVIAAITLAPLVAAPLVFGASVWADEVTPASEPSAAPVAVLDPAVVPDAGPSVDPEVDPEVAPSADPDAVPGAEPTAHPAPVKSEQTQPAGLAAPLARAGARQESAPQAIAAPAAAPVVTLVASDNPGGKPNAFVEVTVTVDGAKPSDLAVTATLTGPGSAKTTQPMAFFTSIGRYSTNFLGLPSGTYPVLISTTVDGVVYSTTTSVRVVTAEAVAPTASLELATAANAAGWHHSTVSGTIVGVDNAGGSGLYRTTFSIDGIAPFSVYGNPAVPFTITGEGSHTLEYWVEDIQNNVSAHQTAMFMIDSIAPVVDVVTPAEGDHYAVGQKVVLDFSCDDAGSGLADCDANEPGEFLDTALPGTFSFIVTAVDNAGNQTVRTISYTVDASADAPVVSASLPLVPENGWYPGDVPITFTATDPNDDVASIHVIFEGTGAEGSVDENSDRLEVTLSRSGYYTAHYWAEDAAGNPSILKSLSFRIDRDAPVVTVVEPGHTLAPGTYVQGQKVNVDFACRDELSGIDLCIGSTEDGLALPTSTLGQQRFTVEAVDNAGNRTVAEISYTVITPAQAREAEVGSLAMTGIGVGVVVALAAGLLAVGAVLLAGRRSVLR